jgi:hypothetical protein
MMPLQTCQNCHKPELRSDSISDAEDEFTSLPVSGGIMLVVMST